ncbi:hypothetical protein QF035_010608 [Streptomyces umbrinus]|uniref:Uncharacterized protein n=1 Tax=Streptomyces umbrinus TaxID=67370 RepID=A0ABU0TDK0_9ACTN|nr:hypothetical protein [Streptomyces umbrinus]
MPTCHADRLARWHRPVTDFACRESCAGTWPSSRRWLPHAGSGRAASVADLSGVDPRKLPEAGAALTDRMREYVSRWGAVAPTPTPLFPVVDGDVLPATPWEALAGGAARDMELIAGHNRDEFRLFLMIEGPLGQVDENHGGHGPGPVRAHTGRLAVLPRRVPGCLPGVPLRTRAVGLAVPHAFAAPRAGASGRRRPGAHVRTRSTYAGVHESALFGQRAKAISCTFVDLYRGVGRSGRTPVNTPPDWCAPLGARSAQSSTVARAGERVTRTDVSAADWCGAPAVRPG